MKRGLLSFKEKDVDYQESSEVTLPCPICGEGTLLMMTNPIELWTFQLVRYSKISYAETVDQKDVYFGDVPTKFQCRACGEIVPQTCMKHEATGEDPGRQVLEVLVHCYREQHAEIPDQLQELLEEFGGADKGPIDSCPECGSRKVQCTGLRVYDETEINSDGDLETLYQQAGTWLGKVRCLCLDLDCGEEWTVDVGKKVY